MRPHPLAALLLAAACFALAAPAGAQIDQELEDFINSYTGLEALGTEFMFTAPGVDVTVELVGFSFCSPTDPTLPPVWPPVPPDNVYGCENAAAVLATPTVAPPGADLELSIQPLFLDLRTSRNEAVLCGEFGGGTVTEDAFATVSVSLTGRVEYVDESDCVRWVGVPGSEDLVLSGLDVDFDDTCLQTFAQGALGALQTLYEEQFAPLFLDIVDEFLWQRNVASCGVVVSPASWASVKARFE